MVFKNKRPETNRFGQEIAAFNFFFRQDSGNSLKKLRRRIGQLFESQRECIVINLLDAADLFGFSLRIFLCADKCADLYRPRITFGRIHNAGIGPDHIINGQFAAVMEINIVKQLIGISFAVFAGGHGLCQIKRRCILGGIP